MGGSLKNEKMHLTDLFELLHLGRATGLKHPPKTLQLQMGAGWWSSNTTESVYCIPLILWSHIGIQMEASTLNLAVCAA